MRISWLSSCALVVLTAAPAARAVPPTPLDVAGLYAFPGAAPGPASAVSAGLGLSDRWLGEEPFDNPAAGPGRGVMAAPLFVRVKREDLPAYYRNYDESAGAFDVAGGWLSLPVLGLGVALYACEPVLRQEDAAFTSAPGQAPGTFSSGSSARELRAGLALSRAWGRARLGAALEWTRREDAYDYDVTTGNPLDGPRHLDFAGDGFGFQAGARVAATERVTVGGALRYVPALSLSGVQSAPGSPVRLSITGTRDAGWEGGLAARIAATDALRVLVSAGGRTAQAWDGLDVAGGRAVTWGAGLEYAEPDQPLTLRLGLGQEQQNGVPEPRTGVVGLGAGWSMGDLRLDLGALRRSIDRAGRPTSYDDRLVASATVRF